MCQVSSCEPTGVRPGESACLNQNMQVKKKYLKHSIGQAKHICVQGQYSFMSCRLVACAERGETSLWDRAGYCIPKERTFQLYVLRQAKGKASLVRSMGS